MLLDDKQVAIEQLLVAYQESIDHYEDAAAQLDDAALGHLFGEICAARRQEVARLSEIVRASGELPRAPYADREQVRQLLTRLKAALSEDRRRVVLDDRIEHERAIERELGEALALDFPEDTRAYLETLRARQGEVLGRLADARGEEGSARL